MALEIVHLSLKMVMFHRFLVCLPEAWVRPHLFKSPKPPARRQAHLRAVAQRLEASTSAGEHDPGLQLDIGRWFQFL